MPPDRAAPDRRPDPDEVLARLQADARQAGRARLKLYFGAAPGVGKTYTMLEQAQRARAAGEDVVVGVVETHGRPETEQLLAGLARLPLRAHEHRGIALPEFDLEAALARRPACVLVDELAHTNAPGSTHVKRWQDVLDLLEAGIDVHTTLNVQHIESLGDVVQQITGVTVRETVPDAVIERADEIELIDIPPEELLERLAAGKVYVPEVARHATSNYFQRGNLLALRELALRRTAERVDADVLAYRREHGISVAWPTAERILVAVGASPSSERLIRATKRIADSMHADWTAAHVEVMGAPPLGERDRDRLESHLRLAESLGATPARLAGPRVADVLLDHARAHNITRIVAGKPTHGPWRDRIRGSLLDTLIRDSGAIEIHVIAPLGAPARRPPTRRTTETASPLALGTAVLAIAIVTGVGLAVERYATLADMTMMYLIAIAIAALAGRAPALLASSLAVAAYNFCFVPPRFTFAVAHTSHLLTFVVMFAAGLVISTLTGRLRRQERDAILRERSTATLLALTRDIAAAATAPDVAAVAVRHLEDAFPLAAAILVPDHADAGALTAAAGLMPLARQEQAVARWALDHGEAAGLGTDTLPGARILALPLVSGEVTVGVLTAQARQDPRRLGGASLPMLEAFARQTGLALGRVRAAEQAREAALRVRTEELRSSLLSAVSHDLRTPLAVITGAATSLRDDTGQLSAEARADLLASVVEDARRLERVLGNLLQLTRVESGLVPVRQWIPVEELVGAALTRLEEVLGDLAVTIDVPSALLVAVDPVLVEQVLINLIDNALKHGAPPIEIAAAAGDGVVVLTVRDHGAGVPPEVRPRLFDKLVRASTAPGSGLGLAVVRAIVEAHGGTVRVDTPAGGGAAFRVELPAHPADAPPLPPAESAPPPLAEVAR